MAIAEMLKFFDKSLKGVVRGSVVVGGREYPWQQWTGEKMASELLAIDTETELIEPGKVPRLALATVFDGEVCWLVHPRKLSRFVQRNAAANFIAHNAAFDWHVIYRHLLKDSRDTARLWLAVVDEDRLTDTMLLDQLVRIAYGSTNPVPRNLAVIATSWAQVTEVDKDDPWRLRYAEIIGVPWKQVDRDAWRYAAKDPIATRLAFRELRRKARKVVSQSRISQETVDQYGPLSIRIQVKAAIALHSTELRGICIDQDKRADAEEGLRAQLAELVCELDRFPSFAGIFRQDKTGNLLITPGGKPRMFDKRLREVLGKVADKHGFVVEKTATGSVSKARAIWEEHADAAPFIASWLRMEETAKLLQFFRRLQQKRVHPRYCVMVRTGRVSCSSPNIQQIPRVGTFREMFVPRPNHVFLIIDYHALELRTLAKVCLDSFGYSVLAETMRDGRDPHCFTASLLWDLDYEEFLDLKDSDPEKFKRSRQAAKAVNFGVPGGLGSEALKDYARINYGVDLSAEDASEFRQRFLDDIYPEIGQYMTNDVVRVLARNLKCTTHDVVSALPTCALQNAARRIVQGTPKRSGEPYDPGFVKRVWRSLQRINRNEHVAGSLANREAGPELERNLFFGPATTLTGRVRGRTTYTQRHNTPFQGLAADGAKLAVWNLYRSGFRVVAQIHDEFVVELPAASDLDSAAKQVVRICRDSMQQLTGDVPIECEYAVASCWSKRAELLRDSMGKIEVWRPDDQG